MDDDEQIFGNRADDPLEREVRHRGGLDRYLVRAGGGSFLDGGIELDDPDDESGDEDDNE